MWSPNWSVFKGNPDTLSRTHCESDCEKVSNGPWIRDCWRDEEYRDSDDYCQILYDNSGGYSDINIDSHCHWDCYKSSDGYRKNPRQVWRFGTKIETTCTTFVSVSEYVCEHSRRKEDLTEEYNKCSRLKAVRVCTLLALVFACLALFLSMFALVVPKYGKHACLASTGLTLIAGFMIFVAVCIWFAINRWERMIMKEQCRSQYDDTGNTPNYHFWCWGEEGSTKAGEDTDDEWEDIDPPYTIAWAWGIEILVMLIIPGGGLLIGLGGNKY